MQKLQLATYDIYLQRFLITAWLLGNKFDAYTHDKEIKKKYYQLCDDETIDSMKRYFKIEAEHSDNEYVLSRYLKYHRLPKTNPDHI